LAQELGRLKPFEREKNPEELELIEFVNRETDKLREKYGLSPRCLAPDIYHVIKKEGLEAMGQDGVFRLRDQLIAVVETDTKAQLLKALFHETIHAKSFAAMNVGDDLLRQRQAGLVAIKQEQGDDRAYFHSLNEAVTEALAKQACRDNEDAPLLSKEAELLQEAREEYGEDVASAGIVQMDGQPTVQYRFFSYAKERQALILLIDKLAIRNPDSGRDREAWLDLFASAMFTGTYRDLTSAVEKSFGPGTFKKLAGFQEGQALLDYAQSL
jgi:hypothetical protein